MKKNTLLALAALALCAAPIAAMEGKPAGYQPRPGKKKTNKKLKARQERDLSARHLHSGTVGRHDPVLEEVLEAQGKKAFGEGATSGAPSGVPNAASTMIVKSDKAYFDELNSILESGGKQTPARKADAQKIRRPSGLHNLPLRNEQLEPATDHDELPSHDALAIRGFLSGMTGTKSLGLSSVDFVHGQYVFRFADETDYFSPEKLQKLLDATGRADLMSEQIRGFVRTGQVAKLVDAFQKLRAQTSQNSGAELAFLPAPGEDVASQIEPQPQEVHAPIVGIPRLRAPGEEDSEESLESGPIVPLQGGNGEQQNPIKSGWFSMRNFAFGAGIACVTAAAAKTVHLLLSSDAARDSALLKKVASESRKSTLTVVQFEQLAKAFTVVSAEQVARMRRYVQNKQFDELEAYLESTLVPTLKDMHAATSVRARLLSGIRADVRAGQRAARRARSWCADHAHALRNRLLGSHATA